MLLARHVPFPRAISGPVLHGEHEGGSTLLLSYLPLYPWFGHDDLFLGLFIHRSNRSIAETPKNPSSLPPLCTVQIEVISGMLSEKGTSLSVLR